MTSHNNMPLLHGLSRNLRGLLAVMLLSASAPAMADETRISEHQVKTAFL
jgi:hypothetical protein